MHKPFQQATPVVKALAFAFGSAVLATSAYAQAQSTQKQERIEITGSSIKRTVDSEGALPVTILNAKELRESGVTTTEEALSRVSSLQTSTSVSQSIGSGTGGKSNANLRGLGANKTLVLLNGRRMASFAFDAAAVDLNSIPFAAIDRIEVLRDGASAIYGTDAIGGVINFITKSNYTGIEASAEMVAPRAGGGDSKRMTLSGGLGNLDKDGYNFWLTFDNRKQDPIAALERSFAATGYDPARGLNLTSGTTYPANFVQVVNGSLTASGNPSSPGCNPPLSIKVSGATCRFDYTGAIDLVPKTDLTTIAARGSIRIGADHLLSAEFVSANNSNTARVAPDPVTGLTVPASSPFFPSTFPGVLSTSPVTAGWRMVPGGRRTNEGVAKSQRTVIDLSGTLADWDYKAGFLSAVSKADEVITDGYVLKSRIQAGVTSGLLNPFGANSPAALDYINASKAKGTSVTAKGSTNAVDLRASRELFAMGGGNMGVSLGLERRTEKYNNDTDDNLVNAIPSLGRSPNHVGGDRTVTAFTAEFLLPITKSLEIQAALRTDKYSDFGTSTNPKIGFRYQPFKGFVVRGSANTGFKAPTLDDLYAPQSVTFTGDAYDDPVLCATGSPTAGGIAPRDCGQQAQALVGGNPKLLPEKSKSTSVGFAFEPAKDVTVTLDFWNIQLKNQIAAFPEQAVFADAAKYANRYIRCNTLSAAQQTLYDRCQGGYAGGNGIAYVVTLTDNLGSVYTNGIDLGAGYGFKTDFGRFNVNYSGTYVNSYKYQNLPTEDYKQNVAVYQDASPVFRWQHVVGVDWKMGGFGATANIRQKSGYTDQDPVNTVGDYTLVDIGVNYSGFKGFTIAGGVRNLFDTNPPFTNQGTVFQKGYDPRYTDPTGRAFWLRAGYKFN